MILACVFPKTSYTEYRIRYSLPLLIIYLITAINKNYFQPIAHFMSFTQMVPLIKRSTDSLVAVLGEKATTEVTFEAMEYVCLLTATILLLYNNVLL